MAALPPTPSSSSTPALPPQPACPPHLREYLVTYACEHTAFRLPETEALAHMLCGVRPLLSAVDVHPSAYARSVDWTRGAPHAYCLVQGEPMDEREPPPPSVEAAATDRAAISVVSPTTGTAAAAAAVADNSASSSAVVPALGALSLDASAEPEDDATATTATTTSSSLSSSNTGGAEKLMVKKKTHLKEQRGVEEGTRAVFITLYFINFYFI